MLDIGMPYYFFGSKDSVDIDVLIYHPSSTGAEDDKSLICGLKEIHQEIGLWQINIVRIIDGIIVASIPSKGGIDGVNNSLFETYHLHEQAFPFPLKRKVPRIKILAIVKCLRAVLTSFNKKNSGDYYTKELRPIIKGDSLNEWINLLGVIDLNEIEFEDEMTKTNKLKSLAFHVGQTISLLQDIEIYTKQELVYWHPELLQLIKRKHCNGVDLIHDKLKELQGLISLLNIVHNGVIVEYDNIYVNFKTEIIA